MYNTLASLQKQINNLIERQGPDAPVASFIFTGDDCFTYDMDDDPTLQVEQYLTNEQNESVLMEVGNSDYIYEQINEIISDQIRYETTIKPGLTSV